MLQQLVRIIRNQKYLVGRAVYISISAGRVNTGMWITSAQREILATKARTLTQRQDDVSEVETLMQASFQEILQRSASKFVSRSRPSTVEV